MNILINLPYAALKAREYLDKPAIHETMVQLYADVIMQVSAYLLGEYSHLLARRPGCSPKDIFVIIHEKLPTDSNNIHSSLNIRKDFDALSTTRSRITKPDLGNIQQVSL
uniref:Uncharacterized protein n=1 Tax=Lactuca sativa TaxID=4236 RepID=A0A9R1VWX3_LACSA|nr:hypothetical protein LSAT_V11C400176270 [Lactuca sativa]